ncbi:MAG: leucyl-tRNA ligase LeuS [Candidatus Berkelbacteria bacterium Licking1014_85]|uniref:Leucine--tRNA ligase n=1 Tax=Candidatus Berkelbacteria bacterium Licking1014_85 TaxID=2017148 RepID=A0A554LMV8_9BACT|nr:MAG: leucyl-tRNA ligase LeuS [Candidatus Berkelbacteria bacterium Licking1014_85]
MNYDFKTIEKKWQKIWKENPDAWQAKDMSEKPKFYCLFEFPYPSGDGLHIGHLRGQTFADVIARKKRLEGFNVMNPIGWDAFGLPTENYAIKHKIHPSIATAINIKNFTRQEKMMGYLLDWSREINTTDLEYFKWTQWIFLKFYEHGLAYKAKMPINWCPQCKIGLANEEVIDGFCERCGTQTETREINQWMLKITAYADKLIEGLKNVDFPEQVKTQQINWIGRSEGAMIKFQILNTKCQIDVFTTRPDTLFGATYMVLSPNNKLIQELKNKISNINEVQKYIIKSNNSPQNLAKNKTGVELKGIKAVNPVNETEIPIWVSDYVLDDYGTGAIMAVPAHDERDYAFAKKFNLPITEVIQGGDINKSAYTDIENGILINSGEFSGLKVKDAIEKISLWLENNGIGKKEINYKLRDWVFSRQHYWGEPIPIIYCPNCGTVPLPENQLPLKLPGVEHYEPTNTGESPLSKMTDWVNTTCPKCYGKAIRETDTMPNWAGSSWYFLRYIDPQNTHEFASQDKLKYWMPVDLYEGGMEHTTLHLLYSRFWNQFLYDIGLVPFPEPYKKRVSHGIILASDNKKMSKSLGNIINPDEIIDVYGADTVRTFEMFIGPFDQAILWDPKGIKGVSRFLNKVRENILKPDSGNYDKILNANFQKTIKGVTSDIDNNCMNTAIAKLMNFNNFLSKCDKIPREVKKDFLIMLNIFAPHLTSELLEKQNIDVFTCFWPKFRKENLLDEELILPIQVNGKLRSTLIVNRNTSEKELKEIVVKDKRIAEILNNKKIIKIIIVPLKIISIVVK